MGIAGTILFVLVAIVDGAIFTHICGKKWPLAVRLCAGACTGFALVATVGFLAASVCGLLNPAVAWISLILITAPALAVARAGGPHIRQELAEAGRGLRQTVLHPSWLGAGLGAFYAGIAVFLGRVFGKAVYWGADGIYTGVANNLGDLPFHLQIISSFALGRNFPPQDPGFAGVRFAYPFLVDFLAAMMKQTGASLIAAIWIESVVLAIALVGLLHYWTRELTGDRLAGWLAPVLIVFSGGLGWWALFQDVRNSDSGFLGLLKHLPHGYTIGSDALWRWGNSFSTLFVPQRSILLGMPLAVVIFTVWWQTLTLDGKGTGEDGTPAAESRVPGMIAAGCLAGMLPLIHAHTYLVVMMTAGCLLFLFPKWLAWAAFFPPALLIAVPELLWTKHGSGVDPQTFFGWYLGWDHGNANALWFWFVNTGAFIPLLVTAVLWRQREESLVPPKLLRFYLPFLLCFIAPNVIKFAPWGWDNIKVLFYWYVASAPLVALLLASWWKTPGKLRWMAAGLLVSLTLAGALDLVRVVTGGEANREFDPDGVAIARMIDEQTAPHAVVLHAPTYNPPVFLTGRRSLLGYPGQAWSRGLAYTGRESDIHEIYAGSPQAASLLRSYHVDYAVVSPQERGSFTVNDAFWNQFPVIAQSGNYRVYKVESVQ